MQQKDILNDGPYSVYGASGIVGTMNSYQNDKPYIAVVKDGAGVGRANVCEAFTSVLGTMQALIPNDLVECDYLLYLVRSLRLGDGFSGSTIPHIYFKDYGKVNVALPELSTQKQIVALFHKIENEIKLIQLLIDRLDQLIKSRFVEIFGDPIKDSKWEKCSLDNLSTKLGSGATPRGGKSSYKSYGIPFIRSLNVYNGHFSWKDLAYIDDQQAMKLKNVVLEEGDVLLNITGASVARSCLLPSELAGGRVNQHVAIIRPDSSRILPIVLNELLISDSYQDYLLKRSRSAGATREAITKSDLKEMIVPLPPLLLQQEFANFVAQVDKSRFADLRLAS